MELGMGEILFILLVALLVYGGRLPEVAAAVGRSIGELKRGLRDTTDLVREDIEQLADLDPRRAMRRAWKPPRIIGDDHPGPHPGSVASLPAPETEAEPGDGDDLPDTGAQQQPPASPPDPEG